MNTNLHFVRDHHGSDKVSPVSGAEGGGHVFLQMVLIFSPHRFLILTSTDPVSTHRIPLLSVTWAEPCSE